MRIICTYITLHITYVYIQQSTLKQIIIYIGEHIICVFSDSGLIINKDYLLTYT